MDVDDISQGSPLLQQYARVKQEISVEIRKLREFMGRHIGERESEQCRQLMAKLVDDRFTLAVVGQFKRGKSSLMNAIIGREVLPTGVLPLTSAITVLQFDPRESLTLFKENVAYPQDAPIAKLADYVTENGNPGNVKKVARVVLKLPLPFLQRGLEFVDTPGIGSASEANTIATQAFIPQSDAVIFVTSVDTPLTQAEIDFLQNIREHVRKIFFVVNKIDLVTTSQQQEILDFIRHGLKQRTGADAIRLFPLSSTQALAAAKAGKPEEIKQSGLPALQEALADFLSKEKNNTFLVSILDKTLRLSHEASRQMRLLKLARETSHEVMQQKMSALGNHFKSLRQVRKQFFTELHESLMQRTKERIAAAIGPFVAEETSALANALDSALSRASWKLSFMVVDASLVTAMPRLEKELDAWPRQLIEGLEPELRAIVGKEWVRIELELRKIAATSLPIFDSALAETLPDAEQSEPSLGWVLAPPHLAMGAWRPDLPLALAYLPVFLNRSRLRKRLSKEMSARIGARMAAFYAAMMQEVQDATARLASDVEQRAAAIENRIIRALMGQRLVKGLDGNWRVSELDPEELNQEMAFLAEIERKLLAIRTEMLQAPSARAATTSPVPPALAARPAAPWPESLAAMEPPAASMDQEDTGPASDFDRDLATRGCPACAHMIRATHRFLARFQYTLAVAEQTQRLYASTLGFCPLHTWQLAAVASPQGLSQGYPPLLERLSADLSRLAEAEETPSSDAVRKLVQSAKGCRLCQLLQESETDYLKRLAAFIETEHGRKVYAYAQGVCLRHLGQLIDFVAARGTVRLLVTHASRKFSAISDNMQAFALKYDARRGHSQNKDERDASMRALIHTAGEREVCFPWELDVEV